MIYKSATLYMDSGEKIVLMDTPLKEVCDLLKKNKDIRDVKQIIFNDTDGITSNIIFLNHISHINFER